MRQDAILLAWPKADSDWRDDLDAAQATYRRLIGAIAAHQPVVLVAPDDPSPVCPDTRHPVYLVHLPYDDTWVRDSGPLTLLCSDRSPRWADFRFDAWGGKFPHERDDALVAALHAHPRFSHLRRDRHDWVLEGGAIEVDGAGMLMTTASCLEQRFPDLDRAAIEARLCAALGVARILWLEHGFLAGDDTDGHVDTLARFAGPRHIVYQACEDREDEHYDALARMEEQLTSFRNAQGQPYQCTPLPLPSARFADGGRRLPAGYANFLILNDAVLMPTYGDAQDRVAAERLASVFPGRRVVGVDCTALIHQGGSLHCATMQLPAGTLR